MIPEVVSFSCVGEATKGLLNRTRELESQILDKDEAIWKLENRECKEGTTQTTCTWKSLEVLEQEMEMLQEKLAVNNNELNRVKNERQELKVNNSRLKKDLQDCREELAKLDDLNRNQSKIIQHVQEQDKKWKESPPTADKEIQVKRVQFSDQEVQVTRNCESGNTTEDENDSIDSKLERFSVGILSKVTQIMEEKLNGMVNLQTATTNEVTDTEQPASSWSKVASQPQSFKSMMHEARNEEKLEENEKKKRASNIIIHGAQEIGDTPNDINESDSGYIKEFFTKLGVGVAPSSITRLGESKDSKCRPIKIVMKTKEDKDKVMANLGRLKGTERYFGKISVKDDYTSNERDQIRKLTEEAKKLSEDNQEKVFKVRGNQKNGWRVVSFLRK